MSHKLFTSGDKTSVFTQVRDSLNGLLGQRHTYLLEGFHNLVNCSKGVFIHEGKNYSDVHHNCFLWPSWPFGVPELTSAFFLLKKERNIVTALMS